MPYELQHWHQRQSAPRQLNRSHGHWFCQRRWGTLFTELRHRKFNKKLSKLWMECAWAFLPCLWFHSTLEQSGRIRCCVQFRQLRRREQNQESERASRAIKIGKGSVARRQGEEAVRRRGCKRWASESGLEGGNGFESAGWWRVGRTRRVKWTWVILIICTRMAFQNKIIFIVYICDLLYSHVYRDKAGPKLSKEWPICAYVSSEATPPNSHSHKLRWRWDSRTHIG